ncbi:MAG: L,D-transpeptidase family protein [Chloroflexota bacterium]|nr:L,D-transpeptidase family protein [Chloroflexota bacterium]
MFTFAGGMLIVGVVLAIAVTRAASEPGDAARQLTTGPTPSSFGDGTTIPRPASTAVPPSVTPVIPTMAPATPTEAPPTATPAATNTPSPRPTETTEAPTPTAVIPTETAAPTDTPVVPDLRDDPRWEQAIRTPDGAVMGVVIAPELHIRDAPSLNAPIVGLTYERHTVTVYELVANHDDGDLWYRIGGDRYVSAWHIEPFAAPPPTRTYAGHWVDVNLTEFYAIAYDGDTPVYAAIIAAGRDGKTPVGEFHVFYRVADETMDSATVGIPKGDPAYYYLEHVLYTQYFKEGGYAIHGNYWTPPSAFGGFTSNGCVGLMEHDAAWFWNFLAEGSMINIHV